MRGVPGLRGPGRMTRMAIAICGSAKRAAPNRLIGRAEPETQTGQSPLPNTAADRAGERWRDPLRSIPSFPLTFGPTRIVIPLARYR